MFSLFVFYHFWMKITKHVKNGVFWDVSEILKLGILVKTFNFISNYRVFVYFKEVRWIKVGYFIHVKFFIGLNIFLGAGAGYIGTPVDGKCCWR